MDKATDDKPTVPAQEKGVQKNILHSIEAADEHDARRVFLIARKRLMDVNNWKEFSGNASATFRLLDGNGNEAARTIEKGDYFSINLPAPGNIEGHGSDWVRVEEIEESQNPDQTEEFFAVRVRPASNPLSSSDETAHFFKDDATSSFIIERHGNKVEAAVMGRNEVPNTEAPTIIDKVRNAIVGTTAIIGFSNIQWKNLLKGILSV